nr:D-2-hydroxyacid dehydrogenase [Lysinibacillus timonensis]
MKVYFTFVPRPDLQEPLLKEFPNVHFVFHSRLDEEKLKDTEVLVTYGEDLNEYRIQIAQNLKWIFVVSAGIEKMPHQAIADRRILVSNVRGIHKKPMTESILAHILAIKRVLPHIYEKQKQVEWNKKANPTELNGSTAIIVGPGAIGSEIGRLLQAFEVYTIGCNKSGNTAPFMNETFKIDSLFELLPRAEIVISVLPSTSETKHLFSYEHFKQMPKETIFLNFGRGDLVATDVLLKVLEERLIEHVVLDVFEEEPLPDTSKLWQMDNITISPHCSSHSSRYVERSLNIFKPSLTKWLKGERNLENKMDILRGY